MTKEVMDISPKQLNVIALVSGGKDSLYSILHCIRNGHRVVALANLHPPLKLKPKSSGDASEREDAEEEEEEDMDSYMYQTIGYSAIPLYESALGIPLYRAPILGSAVEMGREYAHAHASASASASATDKDGDETESLVPLLRAVMRDHPDANAVSAGAILSTYQRTRIENVAGRLGLVSLAWLWMYPSLPPPEERLKCSVEMGSPAGLLEDMAACGCEARIVKVASGGLDERFLWMDLSEEGREVGGGGGGVREKVVAGMRRFVDEREIGGAVLGEGGEYETLAVDGPGFLWKGKIVVEGWEERIGEGGVGFVRLKGVKCVEKDEEEKARYGIESVRVPLMLDDAFMKVFDGLRLEEYDGRKGEEGGPMVPLYEGPSWDIKVTELEEVGAYTISNLTAPEPGLAAGKQMESIAQKLESILQKYPGRSTDDITFSTILLRSMSDFPCINEVYSKLFQKPNPPARVTVACGDSLPEGVDIMVSFVVDKSPREARRGLHVQSRSYWAPANIGPYSQAICVPLKEGGKVDVDGGLIYIAGQIPLEPASMELCDGPGNRGMFGQFGFRSVLSLQHLWRIGRAMEVQWWLGAVAFLAGGENENARARIASETWNSMNARGSEIEEDESEDDDDDEIVDAWDIKYGGKVDPSKAKSQAAALPDFTIVDEQGSEPPPFFAVQVDELPRGSDIEWQSQGVRCDEISVTGERKDGISATHTVVGRRDRLVVSYIGLGLQHLRSGLGKAIRESVEETVRRWPSATFNAVIYTPCPLAEGVGQGQVIPCRSVHGSNGEQLAAGIVLQIRPCND